MQAKAFFIIYLIAMVTGASACLLVAYTKESLILVDYEFNDRFDFIGILVENVGYSDVRLVDFQVNHVSIISDPEGGLTIDAKSSAPLGIPYNWSSGHTYTLTLITSRGSAFSISEVAPQRQPPLEVENVYWHSATNTTTITVRNVGTKECKIIDLYIVGASETHIDGQPFYVRGFYYWVTAYTDIDDGKVVEVNQAAEITLDWPNCLSCHSLWVSGEIYHFQIVPETGPFTQFASTAPF